MIALQLTLVQLRLHYPELFIDVYLDETKCEQGRYRRKFMSRYTNVFIEYLLIEYLLIFDTNNILSRYIL